MSTLIILLTLLMTSGFVFAYLFHPGWRARIEQPKHCFQEQLQRYDSRSRNSACHDEETP